MSGRDIVIVGGGIIGAAVAFHLACAGEGERVLLCERAVPAGAATSLAAALVGEARENLNLLPLVRQTRADIAMLEADFGEHVGLAEVGAVHVARDHAVAALDRLAATMRAQGVAVENLGASDAQARLPWLDAASCARRLFFPAEAYVEPYLLASAYLRAAQRRGVACRTGFELAAVLVEGARVTGVRSSAGEHIGADVVVDAAGAWAALLPALLGLALPMAPVRSQYWITAVHPLFPRAAPIAVIPEARAYARPELGALLFGLREESSVAVDARRLPADLAGFVFDGADPAGWESLSAGAPALRSFFPALDEVGIAHHVSGPSTYTVDGHLVLGGFAGLAGLFVASGCNGAGIACSGGIGRVVGELVRGQEPFVDPAPHRPDRLGYCDPFAPELLARCAAQRSAKRSG